MKIAPGKFALKAFGPGPPQDVAHDVNDWVDGHDLERFPIVSQSSTVGVEPDRGTVLTVVFILKNPTDQERAAAQAAAAAGANGAPVRLSDILVPR